MFFALCFNVFFVAVLFQHRVLLQCVRSPNRIPSLKCCSVCTQRTQCAQTSYKANSAHTNFRQSTVEVWRSSCTAGGLPRGPTAIDRCRTNLRKPQGSELLLLLTVPQSCQQYSTRASPQKQIFESMIVFARGKVEQTIGYSSTCHQSLQIPKLKL